MFDIGWQELFVIAVVTVIVIGPKELPRVLRSVSLWVRKIKDMARDFQDGIQELAREAELDDIRKEIEAGKFEIDKEIEASKREIDVDLEKTVDPTGEIGGSIREIGAAVTSQGRDESKKATTRTDEHTYELQSI